MCNRRILICRFHVDEIYKSGIYAENGIKYFPLILPATDSFLLFYNIVYDRYSMAMCLFIFFGCFMGKYILWILAVFHFDKKHICLIVGIQFDEFIRSIFFIIHALAGFDCIIKQVRKQTGYRNI